MASYKVVTPVKTGVQKVCNCLNPAIGGTGFRLQFIPHLMRGRNDGKWYFWTFYEAVKFAFL